MQEGVLRNLRTHPFFIILFFFFPLKKSLSKLLIIITVASASWMNEAGFYSYLFHKVPTILSCELDYWYYQLIRWWWEWIGFFSLLSSRLFCLSSKSNCGGSRENDLLWMAEVRCIQIYRNPYVLVTIGVSCHLIYRNGTPTGFWSIHSSSPIPSHCFWLPLKVDQ